ncbi:MAG: rhodanese-like domain-containing protein [Clostridia bacterium]
MKRCIVILLFAALILGGCGSAENNEESYLQITAEEAAELMAEETDYILLDVRTEEEFEAEHIPGAICVPNETIGTDAIPELPDKDQTILIYCRSGNRSKDAAEKLVQQGYTHIIEFGGINDWNGETVSGEEE